VPRTGGEVGSVFEILDAGPVRPLILKVYAADTRWKAVKERYVYRMLTRHGVRAIPRVLYAAPDGLAALPVPFVVMTRLDGAPLSTVVPPAMEPVFEQLGRLLAEVHRVGYDRWGYLVTGVFDPRPTNTAYMEREFAEKLRWFDERGGDPALSRAVARHVAERAGVFAGCAAPVLCHNDFHEGNVLVDERGTVTGCVDVENAVAADALLDLAKTDYYAIRGDAAKWHALVRGYGPLPPDWPERMAVYRLFHALDYWTWCAANGHRSRLPGVAGDLERLMAGG